MSPITIVSTPERTAALPVSREQAVRLFTDLKVASVEIVDELAAWTFTGGIVLILDHTTEPEEFRLYLDNEAPEEGTP